MSGAGAGAPHLEEEVSEEEEEEEVTVTSQRFLEASAGRPSPSPYLTSSFIRRSCLAIEYQALCWVLGIQRWLSSRSSRPGDPTHRA